MSVVMEVWKYILNVAGMQEVSLPGIGMEKGMCSTIEERIKTKFWS